MKPHALVVAASEMTVRAFLGPQLRAMQEHYDVTVAVNSPATDLLSDLGWLEAAVADTLGPKGIWAD